MTKSRKGREEQLRALIEERVAFNRLLGLRVVSLDPKAPQLRFDMRSELVGNPTRGILHGGVISAVLDVAAGLAIHLALIERQEGGKIEFPPIGTVDLRVDYLRPGRGAHFLATGRVVRLGSRIAAAQMELDNDAGERIATGAAAYLVA
jgi:uncharacterized protein (TIGR00369 family)